MTTTLRFAAVAFVLVATFTTALGQRPSSDPRPLHDSITVHIPKWEYGRDIRRAQGPLRLHGEVVGHAEMTRTSAPPRDIQFKDDHHELQQTRPLLPPSTSIQRRANGTIGWMRGAFGYATSFEAAAPSTMPHVSGGIATQVRGAIGFAEVYSAALRIDDPASELALVTAITDDIGYTHTRFEQVFKGIPVWGRDVIVHGDERGRIYMVNGVYEPTPRNLDVSMSATRDQALQVVVARLRAEGRVAPVEASVARLLAFETSIRTVIYPDPLRGMRVAYEVDVHPNLLEHFRFIVDGRTLKILNRIAEHCSLVDHDKIPHVAEVGGMARVEKGAQSLLSAGTFSDAQATDLNGQTQSLRTYRADNGTYYFVWDLPNIDLARSNLPDKPEGGAVTLSLQNNDLTTSAQLFHITSNNNSWADPASVSAHYDMKVAYDYFRNTHGRKAIDDKDASIISIIHGTEDGQPMDNAYWNGRVMVYGDGNQIFKPLAGSVDVAGHEMSHGVIGSTAGLVYQYQSGALNESFADVFGAMVDRENWLLGENVILPGKGIALRDMSNPANPQVVSPQPGHMNDFRNLDASQDNGGVHVNSGIPNKACYNVAQALGREKTEKIYYRALTKYLNRNSNFVDCRAACEQAATDLYGASDAQTVGNAFGAVGIGPTGGSDPGGDDVPPVTGGKGYIAFVAGTGQVGILDLATNEYLLINHADAIARVDQANDDRAQVTTPLLGNALYFVNSNGRLVSVRLADGQVTVFNISVQSPGDLWNAAISPDENYAALVSAYTNDATMYITDGLQLARIPLLPESTQDGIEDHSILYPDAISWSRNWKEPRIAFDALNAINVSGGVYTYWGVFEIDFDVEQIYNLVPAQPTDISLGNITYSSTDPDVVAFNVIDEQRVWDIVLGKLTAGGFAALDIPNISIGGGTVTDAARPTFSPTDAKLAFTSAANNALFYFDFSNGQVTGSQFPGPIYNPFWFVEGGGIPGLGVSVDAGSDGSMSLRPNPVSGMGIVTWDVVHPGLVEVDVVDIQGRVLRSVFSGMAESGSYERPLPTDGLASGVYVVRVRAEGRSRHLRFVVTR